MISDTGKPYFYIDTINILKPNIETKLKDKLIVSNEVCLVRGNPVDFDILKVEYHGKLIAFCCDGSEAKFIKSPEKYLKNLSEDGKKFIGRRNNQ